MTQLETAPEEKRRKKRAKEWKQFRRDNLLTQVRLADTLEIARRTVQKIEAGVVTPLAETLRRFEALRERYANNSKK
jgi:DNA-binding XRE family transcriptional regulator